MPAYGVVSRIVSSISLEHVAEAVAWLASPAASYFNGAVLTLDDGAAIVDVGTLAFGQ
jgi:NAD(P)-dependent dehydrogenase (short-subunit alcohol dehydrogenase family)